jgi:hypothetical protein
MHSRIILPLLAALALSAPALAAGTAAPSHPMHGDGDMMRKHHGDMCQDLYPGAVGRLAYLETKLALTAQQKPLFERWKSVRLASVKAHADKCAAMTPPEPGIMQHLKMEQAMLEARLADIRAETPALQALVASLNDDQQKLLEREAMKARHHGMEMMGHHMRGMGHHMKGMGHHRHHGGGDAPPPPPAQQ